MPIDKFFIMIENVGNMISASIPVALDMVIENKTIKRGDKIMLIGTSAGLSIGGLIIEY